MSLASEMMQGGISAGGAKAINGTVASSVSAAGTTLATGTALTTGHNLVTTVAASSGVVLPNSEIGDELFVYNGTTTNPLKVYPPTTSATINQLSAGTAMNLAPYTGCKFKKASATAWSAWLSA